MAKKADLMKKFEKEFNGFISKGMEPSIALDETKKELPKVKDAWAESFFSLWLDSLETEDEVADQNAAAIVTQEEIRALYDGLADNVDETQFDIGTGILLMKEGHGITNTLWEGQDDYPRLIINDNDGSPVIQKIGCAGGVARSYTPTDLDLLANTWKVVA